MPQLPFDFLVPKTTWRPPALSDLPSDWRRFRRVAIDVETRDPKLKELGPGPRRGGYIVGYSVAFEDGPNFYLPTRHEGGGNLDPAAVRRYINGNCATFDGTVVGANLAYDLDFMMQEGATFDNVKWFRDVLLAEPLLDELQDNYSLEAVAQRRLGVGKEEDTLREALLAYAPKGTPKTKLKGWLWSLPAELAGEYAERDTTLPLHLLRVQERALQDEELEGVWDLESQLLPALVRMRRRGVRVNVDKLDHIENWSRLQEAEQLDFVKRETGVRIEVGQTMVAARVAPALEERGFTVPFTTKGKPSIQKEWLEALKDPVADAIRRARKMSQLRTTFVASVRDHMTDGRVHGVLNQLRKTKDEEDPDSDLAGAAPGRLSGEHPNLQQQPARDEEIGPMWRDIYEPEEGTLWGSKDYSQQEPRWLVHWSVRCGATLDMRKIDGVRIGRPGTSASALRAAEKYRNDRSTDNHQMMAELVGWWRDSNTKEQNKRGRKNAKELYLGKIYGMGGAKLATKLGYPTAYYVRSPQGVVYPLDSPAGRDAAARGGRTWLGAGEEAQKIINEFDDKVPFAGAMARLAEKQARQNGYIRTHSGRKCRFPRDADGNVDWAHKSLNRLIQGSSADQTKAAVVALDQAGYFIQLQVHDEITGSYETRAQAEEAGRIMETVIPMEVPSVVDVETGRSWGDSM